MLGSHVDGVLYGQYVFNGAGQTGRASSRGVQVHNLARDTLTEEHSAIELLLSQGTYGALAEHGDGAPVARKLSLLIRPAFVPANGRVFVWSDWSQIEARVLPWLGDHHPGARAPLADLPRRRRRSQGSRPLHPHRRDAEPCADRGSDQADAAARQGRRAGAGVLRRRQCPAGHGGRLRAAFIGRGSPLDRRRLAPGQSLGA